MDGVTLVQAFVWDCPKCGNENWQRAVVQRLSREEAKECLVKMGHMEEWQEQDEDVRGELVGCPEEVHCDRCKEVFEPIQRDPLDDDEDEDNEDD